MHLKLRRKSNAGRLEICETIKGILCDFKLKF